MSTDTQSQPKARPVKAWIIGGIAAVASFGAGLGVGLAADDDQEPSAGTEVPNVTETDPAPMHTPESEPEAVPDTIAEPPEPAEPTGPEMLTVGEPGAYSEDDVEIGTITIESFDTSIEAPDEYSEPPINGHYLTVTVVGTALEGQLYDLNPFDFYVRDAQGNRWDQSAGNGFYASGDNDLTAVTLNGGETVRGTVSFDVPPEATEVVYAPGMRALGVWELVH